MNISLKKKGFTLVEIVVGTAVFLVVAISAYNAYVALIRLANASQARILGVELADEQFEIIRNMPYVNVGLTDGIPLGVLPRNQTVTRGGFTFNIGLVVRSLDLSTSTVQASTKQVEVDIDCTSCTNFTTIALTGQVSPANLASAASGGALVVQVFDSSGVPIQGATVVVQSTATSSVTDTDTTNKEGLLDIVGVPPGANVYRVTVTKAGYSTARTYPLGGAGNPNPTLPDVTVASGTVTQVSLSIDKLSTLNFSSVNLLCAVVPNLHFHMTGAKQIGASVPKYSQDLVTGASGALSLPSMEWDTYTITPTDSAYDVSGITPFNPFALNAGNTQRLQFIATPNNPRTLQIAVADSVTKLPLSGAIVQLSNGAGYDETNITGQGYVSQTDWSGGSGQTDYSVANRYYFGDGNVDTSTSSGSIVMSQAFGLYNTSATATLESSTFDTGTTSNFYALNWKPLSQPALAGPAPLKFQFATNPTSTSTVWTYLGPDGTPNTYFTVPGTQVSATHNGNEFARYAAYLTTDTATITPSVNDVSFTYTSGCTPPGQVIFQGLSSGAYTLTVSKAGYTTSVTPVTISGNWQNQTVLLGL
ncbi:MAG: hypothetical protein JWO00_563 [Candidatus Parcubacteria bacterium]|nr:hypothetical protein [Candidatus Parcubacteria bacterium]